ncbi:T6SS immunity protein Tli4 family protein [Pseudomonas aeruginosa]
MMHPRRLLAVLGVVVLTSMTSCTSFSSSRSSSMDKTGWITHCFGRFLIDLPPDAVINAGYYLWGDRIEYLDDKPTELAARVDRLEQEWRTQRHKSKGNMFLRKIDFGNESVGLLSWSSEVASKTYLLDTYVTSKPTWHAYRWKGKVSVDREQHAVEISRALARNLRSRAPKEIPSEPGFCIDHAYIAGDSFQVERFGVGVTFPEHPGARFEFRSSTGAELNSLLERVDGFVQNMLSTFAGMETLRKGKHPVGSLPGEEYLVAGSNKGQRAYTFMWEVQGKEESLTEPNLTAGLAVLERSNENGKPPPPAFKSDKEALELWDTIVDSIRVRPTSSSPRGGNAGPSPAPKPATPGGQTLGDHYVYEEFLSSLKPKDSSLDDL